MQKIIVIINIIGLFIAPSIVAADQTILEVIQLKHRTTNEIIPLIDPFLDKQGALSGMQGKLIIRTTPENLREIKQLLNEIDNAPRRLIITVKQDVDSTTARSLLKLSGNISKGGAQVGIAGRTGNRGLVIKNGYGKDSLKVQVLNNQNLKRDNNTQRVQVLDGGHALIHIGKSLPIPLRNTIHTPQGTRVIESTQFRDVTIGFIVEPSVSGNNVTLEVSPQRNTIDPKLPGAINVQQINTSVSGRLGEWMNLGDMERNRSNQSFSPNSPHNERITSERRLVLIKVEEIH
jgi:type II secretory pathway component GspD/PulD (secretin)